MLSWNPWKLKIYFFLLAHANEKPTVWEKKNIPLGRGELIRSVQNIAKGVAYIIKYEKMKDRHHNKPSETTTRRILEDLEAAGLIKCKAVPNATKITICNYDRISKMPLREVVWRNLSEVKTEEDNINIYINNSSSKEIDTYLLDKAYRILMRDEGDFKIFCQLHKFKANDIEAVRGKYESNFNR